MFIKNIKILLTVAASVGVDPAWFTVFTNHCMSVNITI